MRSRSAYPIVPSYPHGLLLFFLWLILVPPGLYGQSPERRPEAAPAEILKEEPDYRLTLLSRSFAQGELIVLKLSPRPDSKMDWDQGKVVWNKKDYSLSKIGSNYAVFLPIAPDLAPGSYILEIAGRGESTNPGAKSYEIAIHKTKFQVRNITLKVPRKYTTKKLPKQTREFIKECERIKQQAFNTASPLMMEGNFVSPVKEGKISSPFYSRRNYINQKGKPHGGTDFQGEMGEPIYATQSGRVRIARPMYYEGLLTVIDHGAKIFSLYMHQSEVLVKEGDYVKKGALIGQIGSTGKSTGPHLHFGMWVQGTLIDPLSVLALRIF